MTRDCLLQTRKERLGPGDWFGGQTLFKPRHDDYSSVSMSTAEWNIYAPFTFLLCIPFTCRARPRHLSLTPSP